MNYSILSPEDLVRWYSPKTEMEVILYNALVGCVESYGDTTELENRVNYLENKLDNLESTNETLVEDLNYEERENEKLKIFKQNYEGICELINKFNEDIGEYIND